MTYDKPSFLAGLAVGRQLKGWGAGAGRGTGFYYTDTGERELVNRQGGSEFNRILLPAGTRYCAMYVPDGYMYVFAAAEEAFTLRSFSNNNEENILGSGRITLGDRTFYYACNDWTTPLPTPLVDCVCPVRSPGGVGLSREQLATQGILYLFGDR